MMDLQIIFAAELFSKLSAKAKDAIIEQMKSFLEEAGNER